MEALEFNKEVIEKEKMETEIEENKHLREYSKIRKKWNISPTERIIKNKKPYDKNKERKHIRIEDIQDDIDDFTNDDY